MYGDEELILTPEELYHEFDAKVSLQDAIFVYENFRTKKSAVSDGVLHVRLLKQGEAPLFASLSAWFW